MIDLRNDLADYVGVLSKSAAGTSRAEDRAAYMQHLAAAAMMFFLIQKNLPRTTLDKWLSDERRTYGMGFLANNEGRDAESAFQRFAATIESAVAGN